MLVVAGYVLYLIARLAADQRTGELALLRARGASRRQLARLAGGEAVLVVAPAALLGAPLAALVLRQGVPAPAGWLVAILAAAFCAAALVLPALRPPARSARRARWSALQRSGADAALVVLALLTWVQLR